MTTDSQTLPTPLAVGENAAPADSSRAENRIIISQPPDHVALAGAASVSNDPRNGKPSASGIERRWLCAGSAAAEKGLPEEASDMSDSGTRIHAALAGFPINDLSSEEERAAEEMDAKTRRLATELEFDPDEFVAEERLWFDSEFSGQPDRVYRKDGGLEALCVDFKSGFLPVTTASKNPQLAALAILVIRKYHVARVHVAIVPRFGAIKEIAVYDLAAATQALEFVREIIARGEDPDAPRTPGERQCKYCRARLACKERLSQMSALSTTQRSQLPALAGHELSTLLGMLPQIKAITADLEKEAKRRLKNGEEVPGYELKEGSPRDSIINLPIVLERVAKLGVTVEQFTAECSITKGTAKKATDKRPEEEASGLRGLLWKSAGLYGVKLDKALEEIIGGCTEPGAQPEPSLVRKET